MKIKHYLYISLSYFTALSAQSPKPLDSMDMALYFPVKVGPDVSREPTNSELYDFIVQFEHAYATPYKDVRGYYHVGVGHLLSYSNGGLNYLGNPKRNNYSITEITELFHADLKIAIANAKKQFKSFDNYNYDIKLIIIDMSFNLGGNGINKFVKFRSAIEAKNYKEAAKELKNSLYFKQTGRRALDHYNFLIALG